MRASVQSIFYCALLFFSAVATPLRAEVITNFMSPLVSYHYAQNLSSEVLTNGGVPSPFVSYHYLEDLRGAILTNGGILSPIVSYHYFEWPGDDVLGLKSSPVVSYSYPAADTPPLILFSTSLSPSASATTPQISPVLPFPLQLKTFQFGQFTTNPFLLPDTNRMTIVLTHGWNSDPGVWASNMAVLILEKVSPTPNILAWDWKEAAATASPYTAARQTKDQGTALGRALIGKLGANYPQPIHFLGHSLGTLVNAAAADYAHGDAPNSNGAFDPQKTHMTLFDEAEIATPNHSDTQPYYGQPLPKRFYWADNFVSLIGFLHTNAANVILTYGSFFPVSFHGYPYRWYDDSITNAAGASALMGFRWSFENGGLTQLPTNNYFLQNGSDLNLTVISYVEATNFLHRNNSKTQGSFNTKAAQPISNTIKKRGLVNGQMDYGGLGIYKNMFIKSSTSRGGGNNPFVLPQKNPGSLTPKVGNSTNNPVYVWIPLFIPANTVSMSFDFKVEGEWQNDSLAAALNETNVLLLAGNEIETNVLLNSGLIDVSNLAGNTNELFIGIVGGTSTNAQLTVQDLNFYSMVPPLLQAQIAGNDFILTWPFFAGDYALQSTTNLANSNSWTTLTNTPAIVDLQNALTNPVSGNIRFYRLKK